MALRATMLHTRAAACKGLPRVNSRAINTRRTQTTVAATADDVLATYHAHQKAAKRPSVAEEVRTLASAARFAVLCTCDATDEEEFWPAGSVTGVAFDDGEDAKGRAVLALSSLSSHTRDLQRDPRCTLVVLANGFAGVGDARVSIPGTAKELEGDDAKAAREVYLAKHPDAFWVDFGDFSWFSVEVARSCRLVGGFGRAGSCSADQYVEAQPDPVKPFAAPVCSHMNEDHADATAAIATQCTGLSPLRDARIDTLDKLGMDITVTYDMEGGEEAEAVTLPVRVPWPRPAETRGDLKTLIVEMTKAAAAASSSEAN